MADRIGCTRCGIIFGANTVHKCKGVQDARDQFHAASTAEWRLKAALELLTSASEHANTIANIVPAATFEHIANAKTETMVALSQLQTIIKRMPK